MLKAASFEITLRKKKGVPLSRRVSSLKVTFRKGKPLPTSDARVYRYARRYPQLFDIRVVLTDGRKMSADRYEGQRAEMVRKKRTLASEREPAGESLEKGHEDEYGEDDEDDDEEDLTELSADEEWIAIMSKAPRSGPKNRVIEDFAERRKIDLEGKTKKADMIEVIEAVL